MGEMVESRVDVSGQLHCPMCEYDLRGQVEPRCPECGYRFDWDELRDPSRRLHPYLFEHHPERNVRSFFRTLLNGWRPRKFWATLYPTQPSRPRRLILYFMLVVAVGIVPLAADLAFRAIAEHSEVQWARARLLRDIQSGRARLRIFNRTPQQIVDQFYPAITWRQALAIAWQRRGLADILVRTLIMMYLWPLLTLAAMMIFQISMTRARVRPVHALRCVIYSADVVVWVNVLLGAAIIATAVRALLGDNIRLNPWDWWAAILLPLAWIIFAYRLTTAVRLYLRMDHPKSTVLATQTIALLTTLVLLLEVF